LDPDQERIKGETDEKKEKREKSRNDIRHCKN
jgi:hypothetical protein